MLRVIRFILFIVAIMIAVYQAGAQDVPPAPFTLYSIPNNNPSLIRMDYSVGCGTADLTEHQLAFTWAASEWSPQYPNPDTSDRVTYEVVFRIDSALGDGTFTKVERSFTSLLDPGRSQLWLSGQELYDLIWTDGVPVQDRTDSLVVELEWYVVATCTNHGLKTYSDTAGVSRPYQGIPEVTPPVVVSINRPPHEPITFHTPSDGQEIYNITQEQAIEIIWAGSDDINIRKGIEQGGFRMWNNIVQMWETEVDHLGFPRRTIDTLHYMWYGVVTEAWPKPSPATGTAIVKDAGILNAVMLDNNDLDALFQGLQTDEVDSLRIEHCVLVKDAWFYSTLPEHLIAWPYNSGIWQNGPRANPDGNMGLYGPDGCAPHFMEPVCATLTLKKGAPTTSVANPQPVTPSLALSAYPNPFRSSTAITYDLPAQSTVRLAVYDMLGREAALLREGPSEHGTHTLQWSPPAGLPRGNYIIVLTADGKRISTPIVMHQ